MKFECGCDALDDGSFSPCDRHYIFSAMGDAAITEMERRKRVVETPRLVRLPDANGCEWLVRPDAVTHMRGWQGGWQGGAQDWTTIIFFSTDDREGWKVALSPAEVAAKLGIKVDGEDVGK